MNASVPIVNESRDKSVVDKTVRYCCARWIEHYQSSLWETIAVETETQCWQIYAFFFY